MQTLFSHQITYNASSINFFLKKKSYFLCAINIFIFMIQQMGGHLKNSDLRNATRVGLREPAREEKNVGGQLKN